MLLFLILNTENGSEKIFKSSSKNAKKIFNKHGPQFELYRLKPQLEAVHIEHTDRQIHKPPGEDEKS